MASLLCLPISVALLLAAFANSGAGQYPHASRAGSNGPANQGPHIAPPQQGNAALGQAVFRFGTFGDEGFWTDAARVPKGMMDDRLTPFKAMKAGLCFDVNAIDSATRRMLAKQLRKDPTGQTSALLNDPKTMIEFVNENALIGLPIKANSKGIMDVTKGAKVGVSCALCHTITDGSLFNMPHGGSIGHREDGCTNHNLSMGDVLATAANSRAVYPLLQLSLKANHGKTFGRAPTGLTENSTEAEVDAYLKNPKYYPVGMFDDTYDGNGDQMQIAPVFRQDLAAPFLSGGSFLKLEDFSNLVYTSLFDPTTLTTPAGRALLHKLAGAAGDEIADNYVKVLAATGVTGYPYVKATPRSDPNGESAPVGLRVDNAKLLALNAYLVQLQAPPGARVDPGMEAQGRQLFRTVGCTGCHNVDQGKPVPTFIVPMKTIFPGDNPVVLAKRKPPLTPFEVMPGSTFDVKMGFINASLHGGVRGIAMPLLLDLARQRTFLHDDSVPSLDNLLDPARGSKAPHPFYVSDKKDRRAVVAFLRGLGTNDRR
ncbi:MAG: hypothetical protein ACRD4O_02740 [Bryobacteraceae bacterium]